MNHPHLTLAVRSTPEMEFIENKVQEIWSDQDFVSSQMGGVESWLVALEKVASSFSHFNIEHWIPAQAVELLTLSIGSEQAVRKLDLSHLCFSLNFCFLMFLRLFPSMFPLLTYSQSFILLIC